MPPEGSEAEVAQKAPNLAEHANFVLDLLKTHDPVVIEGMDPQLHYLAPNISKKQWNTMGDLVASREKSDHQPDVPGEQWFSLRLDGSGFSKAVKAMRQKGVLEHEGFSDRFADCMRKSLRHLMEEMQGCLGFTQSDEMIVFIPPKGFLRSGERIGHVRNGRVMKICTLAAGIVTAKFIMDLAELLAADGKGLDDLSKILPHFDCRLARYDSWEEARALLMWRAFDCSVNGVSDAVHHSRISDGKQEAMKKHKEAKVEWLWRHGLLPLPQHQAYGHLLRRVVKEKQGYNPKTEETVTTTRPVIESLEGPVLSLFIDGSLLDPPTLTS